MRLFMYLWSRYVSILNSLYGETHTQYIQEFLSRRICPNVLFIREQNTSQQLKMRESSRSRINMLNVNQQ